MDVEHAWCVVLRRRWGVQALVPIAKAGQIGPGGTGVSLEAVTGLHLVVIES